MKIARRSSPLPEFYGNGYYFPKRLFRFFNQFIISTSENNRNPEISGDRAVYPCFTIRFAINSQAVYSAFGIGMVHHCTGSTPLRMIPDEKNEINLIERLLCRDVAASREFVEQFGPRLLHAALKMGLSRTDAEELANDTLSESILSLDRYRGRSTFFSYIYGIFLNLYRVKRRCRRRESELPDNVEIEQAVSENNTENPSVALVKALPEALAGLPEALREIVLLRYVDNLSVEQIAARLGKPEGTVKSRLHNARLKLKNSFKKMNLFEQGDTYKSGECSQ